jgi:hypothetical protein
METKNDTQGAPGKTPLYANLPRAGNNCVPLHDFSCLPTSELAVAKLCDLSQAGLVSVGFQTCRIAYSLKSAGREVAPAVGLEICAAAALSSTPLLQFEFVVRGFLPALNLPRQTGSY